MGEIRDNLLRGPFQSCLGFWGETFQEAGGILIEMHVSVDLSFVCCIYIYKLYTYVYIYIYIHVYIYICKCMYILVYCMFM